MQHVNLLEVLQLRELFLIILLAIITLLILKFCSQVDNRDSKDRYMIKKIYKKYFDNRKIIKF